MIIVVYYIQSAKIAIIIELHAYRMAFFDIFIIFAPDMLKGSALFHAHWNCDGLIGQMPLPSRHSIKSCRSDHSLLPMLPIFLAWGGV